MLAHQTYPANAPESQALRRAFVCTAGILAAVAVVLRLASHPVASEEPDSGEVSRSALKFDAYRQPKTMGSAFTTRQHRPMAVTVAAHASPPSCPSYPSYPSYPELRHPLNNCALTICCFVFG